MILGSFITFFAQCVLSMVQQFTASYRFTPFSNLKFSTFLWPRVGVFFYLYKAYHTCLLWKIQMRLLAQDVSCLVSHLGRSIELQYVLIYGLDNLLVRCQKDFYQKDFGYENFSCSIYLCGSVIFADYLPGSTAIWDNSCSICQEYALSDQVRLAYDVIVYNHRMMKCLNSLEYKL